jgi:hypothetical protein
MKFGPVPEIAQAARPWAKLVTVGPPPGKADQVGSLDMQVEMNSSLGGPVFRAFVELEEGDLEKIQAGNPIELAVFAYQMVPVSLQVWANGNEESAPAVEELPKTAVGEDVVETNKCAHCNGTITRLNSNDWYHTDGNSFCPNRSTQAQPRDESDG